MTPWFKEKTHDLLFDLRSYLEKHIGDSHESQSGTSLLERSSEEVIVGVVMYLINPTW